MPVISDRRIRSATVGTMTPAPGVAARVGVAGGYGLSFAPASAAKPGTE
jgi:hypothetical protein